MTHQFFTGMLEKLHSVVDSCNKTAVSEDNSRDVTPSPKQQRLSNHFETLFVDCVRNVMAQAQKPDFAFGEADESIYIHKETPYRSQNTQKRKKRYKTIKLITIIN
jgi:hypothetical protein